MKTSYKCGHTSESPGQMHDLATTSNYSQDRKDLIQKWAHTKGSMPERQQCWTCFITENNQKWKLKN